MCGLVGGESLLLLCIHSSVLLVVCAIFAVMLLAGEGASFLRWRTRCLLREEAPIPDKNGMCCLFGCELVAMVAHDCGIVVVLGVLAVEVMQLFGGGWCSVLLW